MMKRHLLLILFCVVSFFTNAQGKYYPLRITKSITFDGQLKESVKNRKFGANLRLQYNPREGTDLYFVVNQNMNTNTSASNLISLTLY